MLSMLIGRKRNIFKYTQKSEITCFQGDFSQVEQIKNKHA